MLRLRPTARFTILAIAVALLATPHARLAAQGELAAVTPRPPMPQPVDSVQFRGMKWRSIGPNRGGRSIAVAGSASRPLEYFFGAVGGGVWKTLDGGTTWKPVTDGQLRSSSVGALAVAESNPDVVYAGMGETCLRGNIMQGDGVYKSTDAGKTWTHVGLAETHAIAKIRVDPRNPDVVWVAALGHPYGRNTERGVFKSVDGGKSWRKVLYRDDQSGAIDLSLDPKHPDVLYAALWDAYRKPWQMSSGGPGSGLFTSRDGGEHWTEITRNPGLPDGVVGRIGVSVSPADGNRVWAIVENANGGVFRSDDAGATWRRTNDERKLRQRAFYYTHITADPQNRDRVYVQNVELLPLRRRGRALRLHDHRAARRQPRPLDRAERQPADDRGERRRRHGERHRRPHAGRTRTSPRRSSITSPRPPTFRTTSAARSRTTPPPACRRAAGPTCAARGRASSATGCTTSAAASSGYIAPDPAIRTSSTPAARARCSRATTAPPARSATCRCTPRFFSGEPAAALPERWQWTFPIVFSPTDPRTLYTSSQHLWRTTRRGADAGRASARTSRAPIRRRSASRAGRSRTT